MQRRKSIGLIGIVVIGLGLPLITHAQELDTPRSSDTRAPSSARINSSATAQSQIDQSSRGVSNEAALQRSDIEINNDVYGNVDARPSSSVGQTITVTGTLVDFQKYMMSDTSGGVLGNVDDAAPASPTTAPQILALDSPQGLIVLGLADRSMLNSSSRSNLQNQQREERIENNLNNEEIDANAQHPQQQQLGLSSKLGQRLNLTGRLFEKDGVKFLLVNNIAAQPGTLPSRGNFDQDDIDTP